MRRLLFFGLLCAIVSSLVGMDILKFTKKSKSKPVKSTRLVYVQLADSSVVEIPQFYVKQANKLWDRFVNQNGNNSKDNSVDISDIKITAYYTIDEITSEGIMVKKMQEKVVPISSIMLKNLVTAFDNSQNIETFKSFFDKLGDEQVKNYAFNVDKKNLINTAEALGAIGISSLAAESSFPKELREKLGIVSKVAIKSQEPQELPTYVTAIINYLKKPQRLFSERHTMPVTAIACSPTGDYIASGSQNGGIIVWDANTGLVHYKSPVRNGIGVTCIAYNPDCCSMIVGYTDNTFDLLSENKVVKTFKCDSKATCVTYSPDGTNIVAGFSNGDVYLFDAALDKKGRIKGKGQPVHSLVYNPKNKDEFVIGCENKVVVFKKNIENKFEVKASTNRKDPTSCLTYSADGKNIICVSAIGDSKNPDIFNKLVALDSSNCNIATLFLYFDPLSGYIDSNIDRIVCKPNGDLLLVSNNKELVVLTNMKKPSDIIKLSDKANCITYGQDGRYTVVGLDSGKIVLYTFIDEREFNLFFDYISDENRTLEERYFIYRLYEAAMKQKPLKIYTIGDPDYDIYLSLDKGIQKIINKYFPFTLIKDDKKSIKKNKK